MKTIATQQSTAQTSAAASRDGWGWAGFADEGRGWGWAGFAHETRGWGWAGFADKTATVF